MITLLLIGIEQKGIKRKDIHDTFLIDRMDTLDYFPHQGTSSTVKYTNGDK